MILFSKQAFKFLVAFSVLLGVFTEAHAGLFFNPFTATNGTVGTAYSFNLQTMPGAAIDTGAPPAPPFSIFGPVVTVPPGALPNGLNFNATSLITGVPTLAGTYQQGYQIIGGTGVGRAYLVTFNIFAAAAASSSGDSTPVCTLACPFADSTFLSGQSYTVNGGGIINQSLTPSSNATITVGTGGAVLNLLTAARPTEISYNFVLNGPLTIINSSGVKVTYTGEGQSMVMLDLRSPYTLLNGKISGTGSVTVNANTSALISGNNTYTGGTTISAGALVGAYPFRMSARAGSLIALEMVDASFTPLGSGFTHVYGTLVASGTYPGGGKVYDGGFAQPGGSPGYASVGATFSMSKGSTYLQDIAGTVQAGPTIVTGTAGTYSFMNITSGQLTIDSGATLTPRLSNLFSDWEPGYGSKTYIPVLGDRFRIVTAAGGISGRFSTVTQPTELTSGTQLIALYNVNNGNSLDLAIAPTSYSTTLSSSSTNANAVAGVLDQLLGVNKAGTSSAAQDTLLYAVAGQNTANLPGFARSLAGEVHAASVATLPQTTQRVQQSVLARLGDYPMAPSQFNPALSNALLTGGISATNPSGLPTANMSTNPVVNPNTVNVTSTAVADGRAWGEIAYQRTERASNSAGNGYNSNLYQIVTGVDAYSNAELGLKLGGGIALSNTTVAANGGNSTIQQGSLFVYGKMSVLQDYVLDGMASVGLSSTNLSRNDPTGYTGGFSSKAVMSNDALVSVGLSRAFEYNDVRVTPYARLTYQYVGQNSYDEGNGVAALNIARFSGSAVRGVIGVAAGSLNKDPLKDDYTYRANLAVGADTSGLLNPTINTTLGGFSSSVTTATAGFAFVQVGWYGTFKIANNAYAYAGVSGEARSGQTLYGGSVGLRMAF